MPYLLLTALLVFIGVWAYMWSVDGKIARLRAEMREDELENDDQ